MVDESVVADPVLVVHEFFELKQFGCIAITSFTLARTPHLLKKGWGMRASFR
jgi:hypothetical protein